MADPTRRDQTVRVAAVQLDLTPGPIDERLARMAALMAAQDSAAKLVVFPEMSVTGYDLSPANFSRGQPLDGASVAGLREMALRHDTLIVAGLTEARDGRCYNTQVVVGPDGLCGQYRKRHVSSAENAIWHGLRHDGVVETDLGRIGLGICADMFFATPWSSYLNGAVDLIISAAAWPDFRKSTGVPMRRSAREFHHRYPIAFAERLSAQARVPVVLCNGSGRFESRLPLLGRRLEWMTAGHTRIVVNGRTIADDGGNPSEQVVAADIQLGPCPEPHAVAPRRVGERLRHAEMLVGEVATAWFFRLLRPLNRRSA